MKDIYILGIESSCDETSASIVKNGTEEIATVISSQIDIHKNYGGVVPEIASRHHVKNITIVLEECLEKANMTIDDVDAIAITYAIYSIVISPAIERHIILRMMFESLYCPCRNISLVTAASTVESIPLMTPAFLR